MGKLTDEVFNESCCDGGATCNATSAQPCGCDEGAGWTCKQHTESLKETVSNTGSISLGAQPAEPPATVDLPKWGSLTCKNGHIATRDKNRRCIACRRMWDKQRYGRNRLAQQERSRHRMRRGLPTPTRKCPQNCELCGGSPKKRALSLDHDHKTGQFRGWLCGSCNMILGRFGDDVAGLLRAVQYIQRNTNSGGLPADAAKRKEYPIATGVLDYFPKAITEVAHVSYVGNEQHHPGKALHWDRSKSTDEADALMRHFKDRGTLDTDGTRHTAKMAWRALALLQKELEAENG